MLFTYMKCNFGRSNISFSIVCIVFRKGQGSEHPGGPNIAQEYSFAEVNAMTNKFNQILGEGSFGTVCYGKLPNGQEVAVKRLSGNSQQGAQEFYNEVIYSLTPILPCSCCSQIIIMFQDN